MDLGKQALTILNPVNTIGGFTTIHEYADLQVAASRDLIFLGNPKAKRSIALVKNRADVIDALKELEVSPATVGQFVTTLLDKVLS